MHTECKHITNFDQKTYTTIQNSYQAVECIINFVPIDQLTVECLIKFIFLNQFTVECLTNLFLSTS